MKKIFIIIGLVFSLIPAYLAAKEIKPGVTITRENYREYIPELKRLLQPTAFNDLVSYLEKGIITIPVIKAVEYPQSKQLDEYTVKYRGNCSVGPNNELIGWKAGIPFPDPKNGAELAWNLDRRQCVVDTITMDSDFILFDKDVTLERTYKWKYFNFYYNGRVRVPPIHEVRENNGVVRMKESFVMMEPFDIKGFAFIRTRYEDINKADDVYSYIPAIRRLRRLTGGDTCDPMLGTDCIYDDFELFRQKITSRMSFKMREQEMLVPSIGIQEERPPLKGALYQLTWEIKPVWILEIDINDPEYPYWKRIISIEKQRLTGEGYYLDTYDRKGNLYRGQMYYQSMGDLPYYGASCWGARYDNHLTGHHTSLVIYPKSPDFSVKTDVFSFKVLLRKAR